MENKPPARIYGVLGYPAKHSLSPLMHNAAFRALKIDAEYRIFEIAPDQLNGFLSSLSAGNIHGLNVTVPYKEKVIDFVTLNGESAHLKQVRAVNTVVLRQGVWLGFNTDIPGFARDLRENGFEIYGKSAAILGAGGASKAVAYCLAEAGARDIAMYDIDKVKLDGIIGLIKTLFPKASIRAAAGIEELDIDEKDLLINATPIGMKPDDPCLVREDLLHKGLFVYDLIYNPKETKLLRLAKERGARAANGLGMLLYQGVLAFTHFTGEGAPIQVMRAALEEGVKKLC
jgi:shikimate dehydrogenase